MSYEQQAKIIGMHWDTIKVNPGQIVAFDKTAQRLVAHEAKARYKLAEAATQVPWYMIAVIHEREASQDWNTQLAQGDPLNRVSRHEPTGAGPFDTWQQGAVWALKHEGLTNQTEWPIEKILYFLENYNGPGYRNMGVPSPYIWAGTNVYKSGKYVGDHDYRPNVVDQQLGCAGMLIAMATLDASIKFKRAYKLEPALANPAPLAEDPIVRVPPKVTTPVITPATTGSWFEAFKRFWGIK